MNNAVTLIENQEESLTLDQVKLTILNFEPVYFPQFVNNPLVGVEECNHRTVFTVPRGVFEASINPDSGQVVLERLIENIKEAGGPLTRIGEVGPNYTPLYNWQLLEVLEPIANSGLVELIGAGSILDGKKVFAQFKIVEYEPVPGDLRTGTLLFANSHDSSIAPGAFFTEVRAYCDNSLRIAMSKAARKLTIRHSSTVFANMQELVEAIDLINQGFKNQEDHLKDLGKVIIQSEEQLRRIIRSAYRVNQETQDQESGRKGRTEDRLVELFTSAPGNHLEGINGTGLALHEAMTYFLTHEQGNSKTTADTRLNNNLFLDLNRQLVDRLDSAILAQKDN